MWNPLESLSAPVPQRGIGVIVPFDFALDRELWRWVPDDVSLHITRGPYVPIAVTVEMATVISDRELVRRSTGQLLTPEPVVVAYACASGSFVGGAAGERALTAAMRSAGAPDAVTTCGALVQALDVLGIRRVAVATPYVPSLTQRLRSYLDENDIVMVSNVDIGLLGQIWKVPYEQVVEIVTAADRPDADGVFISCTNLPTYDVIVPLEKVLAKPVLTANQVTMWAALRMAGAAAVAGTGQSLIVATTPLAPRAG